MPYFVRTFSSGEVPVPRWQRVAMAGALAILAAVPAHGQDGRTHEGFWISFGVGGGWNLTRNVGVAQTSEGGVAFDLRLGGTPSEKVLLGGEVVGWGRTDGDLTLSRGNANFTVMFFPSVQNGVYVKGGLGVATFTSMLSIGNTTTTTTNSGFGGTAGIGWDVRVAKNFFLTPAVDVLYQRVKDADNVILLMTVGVTWH